MPKFVELMTTENKIDIRYLSMFIMKYFEIRNKNTKYNPRAFYLYINVVSLLIYNCICNEGLLICISEINS